MARRKITTPKAARQATRHAAQNAKAATKRAQEVTRLRDQEYLIRWRELRRLGLINTRQPPALKRLTRDVKRRINAEFNAIQESGHYVNGKVERPLRKESYRTKSGRARQRYVVNDHYQFIRTKQKVQLKTGAFKTRKGYLFEKSSRTSKIKVRKGEVYETRGKEVVRRRTYIGTQILELRDDIESGRLKFRNGEFLEYRPWGSPNLVRPLDDEESFLDRFAEYEAGMPPATFEAFLNHTDVYFVRLWGHGKKDVTNRDPGY